MSELYDTVKKIEAVIAAKGLEPYKTKGLIAIKTGFYLGSIRPDTPTDVAKLAKLKAARRAAREWSSARLPLPCASCALG